jgi:hypothetical protein
LTEVRPAPVQERFLRRRAESTSSTEPGVATDTDRPLKSRPVPPTTYRCYKCNCYGHWIKDCPVRLSQDH